MSDGKIVTVNYIKRGYDIYFPLSMFYYLLAADVDYTTMVNTLAEDEFKRWPLDGVDPNMFCFDERARLDDMDIFINRHGIFRLLFTYAVESDSDLNLWIRSEIFHQEGYVIILCCDLAEEKYKICGSAVPSKKGGISLQFRTKRYFRFLMQLRKKFNFFHNFVKLDRSSISLIQSMFEEHNKNA